MCRLSITEHRSPCSQCMFYFFGCFSLIVAFHAQMDENMPSQDSMSTTEKELVFSIGSSSGIFPPGVQARSSYSDTHSKTKRGYVYPIFPASAAQSTHIYGKRELDLLMVKEDLLKRSNAAVEAPQKMSPSDSDYMSTEQPRKVRESFCLSSKPAASVDKGDKPFIEVPISQPTPAACDFCKYSKAVCLNKKLHGLDFCHEHILADKESPFIRCAYIEKSNGKRCQHPAPKTGLLGILILL